MAGLVNGLILVEQYIEIAPEIKGQPNWLLIWGDYGTGKTHLAISAIREIAAKNLWSSAVINWPELCTLTQDNWNGAENDSGKVWSKAWSAKILLIDDLDKIRTSEWSFEKLLAIINYRSNRNLHTIITANHDTDGLRDRWQKSDSGRAIISRIVGQLSGVIHFDGVDQRWETQ